jgi:Subtilase family
MKQTTKILIKASVMLAPILLVTLVRGNAPVIHTQPPSVASPSRSSRTTPTTAVHTTTYTDPLPKRPSAKASTVPAASTPISRHATLKQSVAHEYTYHILSAPNDPRYASDWPLQKDVAPAAWAISTGNNQTTVAVIDSGFALMHEELASQWYTNPGEMGMTQSGDRCWTGTPMSKQANGCDDDNNGYVDDWRGWSFTSNDNNPQAGRTNPSGTGTAHGTEVAGLVGAAGNNSVGSTAINQHTKIMPLQALSDDGIGYTSGVAAAIYYAVDTGAQVINMSLGGYADDPTLKAAIDYAALHNVVIIAAAGNCGDGTGSDCAGQPLGAVSYPAVYPDVIAVGATTQSDGRASFSSFGPAVDVVAPGSNLPVSPSWSAGNPTSLYAASLYGTSFAAPQVSSLASLIKSIRPSTSVQDVTALIAATASKPAAMSGLLYTEQLGHGIINAGTSLAIARALNTAPPLTPTLAQSGSYLAEHSAPTNTTLSSGCSINANTACTVTFTDQVSGYKRYLPYTIASSGNVGWAWSSNMLEVGSWEIQALGGDNFSTSPYTLMRR